MKVSLLSIIVRRIFCFLTVFYYFVIKNKYSILSVSSKAHKVTFTLVFQNRNVKSVLFLPIFDERHINCEHQHNCLNWSLLSKGIDLCEFSFCYMGFLSRTFTNHRIAGERGGHFFNSLLPFHSLHRHLDIRRAITVGSSPLHIVSSRTRTGNL